MNCLKEIQIIVRYCFIEEPYWNAFINHYYSLGIRNLLVEGGDKITKNLLQNKLANQFYLFKSLKKLPIDNEIIYFTSYNLLNKNYKLRSTISSKLAKDNIEIYKR